MEFDNDRKLNRSYTADIVFWALLVLLNPLVTTITLFWFLPEFSIVLLLINVLLFPVYLFYTRILVPGFLFKKKYLAFVFLTITGVVSIEILTTGIHALILRFSLDMPEAFYLNSSARVVVRDTLWSLINISLCIGYSFFRRTADQQQLVMDLQKDNILFRQKYLQAQLNPHFLFNTLNSIYSLSLQKSDKAPDVIIKLADIMRYLIYECSEQKIALDKEIAFINSYIDIEKIRYKADVRFVIEGETKDVMIEPFLFISFIENGFKHAMNEGCEDPFIYITIKSSPEKIELNVINNTNIDLETQSKRMNGSGIKNSRSLLEILYPESHSLNIIQTDIQPKQHSRLRMKNARERLEMYYPDKHNLEAILSNNAFTVSLIVNQHAL